MDVDNKYVKRLVEYFLWVPFAAILLIPFGAFHFLVLEKEPVTWWRCLSLVFPISVL